MTTEKTTHTPGPWKLRAKPADPGIVSEHADNEPWSVAAAGDRYVAAVKTQPEADANARLIAAAPALLEALSGLVQWAEDNAPEPGDPLGEWCEPLIPARTAIAAATEGDQP